MYSCVLRFLIEINGKIHVEHPHQQVYTGSVHISVTDKQTKKLNVFGGR